MWLVAVSVSNLIINTENDSPHNCSYELSSKVTGGKVPVQYFIIFQIQTSDYRDTFIAHIRIMLVTGKYFWYIEVMDKLVTFRFSLDRQTYKKCFIIIHSSIHKMKSQLFVS